MIVDLPAPGAASSPTFSFDATAMDALSRTIFGTPNFMK